LKYIRGGIDTTFEVLGLLGGDGKQALQIIEKFKEKNNE